MQSLLPNKTRMIFSLMKYQPVQAPENAKKIWNKKLASSDKVDIVKYFNQSMETHSLEALAVLTAAGRHNVRDCVIVDINPPADTLFHPLEADILIALQHRLTVVNDRHAKHVLDLFADADGRRPGIIMSPRGLHLMFQTGSREYLHVTSRLIL